MPREFRTILCPTDFSDRSLHALEYGLRFAQASGGVLLVPHVIHVPAGELFSGEHGSVGALRFDEARRNAMELLEKIHREKLDSYPKCELFTEVGDPAQEILQIARDRKVDLIVVSTLGRSGLAHLLMGSVAEKIIRHAPCPVLVVREGVD